MLTNLATVDEALVDEIWSKVREAGGFYSIGDGASREVLKRVLFQSAYVFRTEGGYVRLENLGKGFELHPIILGPSMVRDAKAIFEEIAKRFPNSDICCIIPDGMKAAKRLARRIGMLEAGPFVRCLSGIALRCSVFTRRCENVQR